MCALQSSRPQPEYPCSQQDLYTIVETGWNSYAEYLADFTNLSTLYTAATGTNQLNALDVARKIPDEDNRTGHLDAEHCKPSESMIFCK